MSFERNYDSAHSFEEGCLVVNLYGVRGIVASATALYALVQWEDGREEEIGQGDPWVRVEADGWEGEWDPDTGDTATPDLFDRVRDRFDLWSTAGPKPAEGPHHPAREASGEAGRAAA